MPGPDTSRKDPVTAGTRVAIYVRVSSSEQDAQAQLVRLRQAERSANPVGNRLVSDYVDDGVSGRLDSRPAFDRLRTAIEADGIDEVLAAKLDRLGRSAKNVLEFFDLCEEHGVRVVLVDQSIDTATPVGRLLRTVMAAVAEFEGDLIRERTQQAMAAFKAGTRTPKGRVGRPPDLTPELLAEIARLRDEQRLRWGQIARRVHHPASSCRKWYSASRAGRPTVINPPSEIGALPSAPSGGGAL